MHYQLFFLAVYDNLSRPQFGRIAAPHGDKISRPEGRKHAGPGNAEANRADPASHVTDQFAANGETLCL